MKRSKHNLSHYRLTTLNMGELIPLPALYVLPGDTIRMASSVFLRFSPLVYPPLHPIQVRAHHFFVPMTQLWVDWGDWITGGETGADAHTFPTITLGGAVASGSLANYLGLPIGCNGKAISALPFRCYAHIYNEYYRDQDLQTALTVDTSDGADVTTNQTLKNINWEKDYFTTARLTTQKGDEVTLPLGTSATVLTSGSRLATGARDPMRGAVASTGNYPGADYTLGIQQTTGDFSLINGGTLNGSEVYPTNLYADLSDATAASISDLREAFALQRYREAMMRWGARYPEYLRSQFGVVPSDRSLSRPLYLGGGKAYANFNPVLQTGVTTDATAKTGVGEMTGYGTGGLRTKPFTKFFDEFGMVMTLISVRPKTVYASGIHREWLKTAKEDFYNKNLERIGQQAITNQEVYSEDAGPTETFGYQDMYDEYRRVPSTISGDFTGAVLDDQHLARILVADPTLNDAFVTCSPSTRIFQSTAVDTLQAIVNQAIIARRLVCKVGSPR